MLWPVLAVGAAEITAGSECPSKTFYVESAAGHIIAPVFDFGSLDAGKMQC